MRYTSIDILRTAAMVIMVIVHFSENLAGYCPIIAGVGAPMFMFLSGMSYRLWLNGQISRNRAENELLKISIRRGLFIFILGFAFNVLVWLPEDVYNWDILTLIGCGMLALPLVRMMPIPVAITGCAALILMAPFAQKIADWESFWSENYFDPDWSLSDVIQGFLVTGYFPVIPWIAIPVIGFVTATYLFGEPLPSERSAPCTGDKLRQVIRIASGLVFFSASLLLVRTLFPDWIPQGMPKAWTMFPPSFEYVVGVIGSTLLTFTLVHILVDRRLGEERIKPIRRLGALMGKYSLSFYLLHHIVPLWPLWLVGFFKSGEPHEYWKKAMSVSTALTLAGVFLVACFLLFRWLERNRKPGMESFMRWICD